MRPLARFALAVLILVFAAGTYVQATTLTHSTTDMPMAMSQDGHQMPGCDDSGDDPDALVCFMVCTLPALGLPFPSLTLAPMAGVRIEPAFVRAASGRPAEPDPHPPRPSSLN
jgi:hypothetical protein